MGQAGSPPNILAVRNYSDALSDIDMCLILLGEIEVQHELTSKGDRTGRKQVLITGQRFQRFACQHVAKKKGVAVEVIEQWVNEQPSHMRYTRLKQRLPDIAIESLVKQLRELLEARKKQDAV